MSDWARSEATTSTSVAVRVGDVERNAVVERLAAHAAAGRLTVEELDERVERAHRAVHGAELEVLERDLPARPAPGSRSSTLSHGGCFGRSCDRRFGGGRTPAGPRPSLRLAADVSYRRLAAHRFDATEPFVSALEQVTSRAAMRVASPAIVLAMLPAVLDQTILATALPTIAGELGKLTDVSLVVTAYVVAAAAATPLWGKLGDRHGRKPLLEPPILAFLALAHGFRDTFRLAAVQQAVLSPVLAAASTLARLSGRAPTTTSAA
jgi:DUF1707 SHOCT-like domain/Major Facilitator Superfamily